MGIRTQLEELKNLQTLVLEYIDKDDLNNIEEYFENLINFTNNNKISTKASKLKLLLYLLVNIANNHHRSNNFFEKIERILNEYKNNITQFFSNSQKFKIFKSNKRLLLFLFKEKILTLDQSIFEIFTDKDHQKMKYPEYFAPEIKPFINEENEHSFSDIEIFQDQPDDFEEKRLKGENDDLICELIRKDSKDEFINFVTRESFPLNYKIDESIYETNSFLIKKNPRLIEYAAFFGSFQIFEYLFLNNFEIKPSLWLYSVYGNNSKIINYLEKNLINENKKKKKEEEEEENEEEEEIESFPFKETVLESIKCHHIEITEYILNKYQSEKTKKPMTYFKYTFEKYFVSDSFKYFNCHFYPEDITNNDILFYLCLYDYTPIVKAFFTTRKIDIDNIHILLSCL